MSTPSVPFPRMTSDKRPLAGIKVVELVRIIAGPVIGTTLAALGADVIRINGSSLPDFNVGEFLIESVASQLCRTQYVSAP